MAREAPGVRHAPLPHSVRASLGASQELGRRKGSAVTRRDGVWVPRHLVRAPVGVPGQPPAHVASRASALPPLAPPQGAAAAAAAVRFLQPRWASLRRAPR